MLMGCSVALLRTDCAGLAAHAVALATVAHCDDVHAAVMLSVALAYAASCHEPGAHACNASAL